MNLRAPALTAALLVAGGAWLGWNASQSRAREASEAPAALAAPPGRVAFLALRAVPLRREAGPRQVTVPADTATLRLALTLPPRTVRSWLSAALKTAEGAPVWSGNVAAPDNAPAAIVDLPAPRITRGDYRLVLRRGGSTGFDDIATYPFTVLRD
jgi:hypothetical protein